ncbi:MAG: FCD domain-containing protein [Chloroflexota bacterium]|nr:FCD domain-containing protein [Chloroflexota bacterium]
MINPVISPKISQFLSFLAIEVTNGTEYLPSLSQLSETLGVSVSTLREELQVARAMGLVDVKPRTGIKCLPYSFTPSVLISLAYAVSIDPQNFRQFSDLRNHIEASYWYPAVSNLTSKDVQELNSIIDTANEKLASDPIQVPHDEHRRLHLTIYKRLDNRFVQGILEAYWDIYEAVGLSVYEDRKYLERVWLYHKQMVDAITTNDYLHGYHALIAHMDLLFQREQKNSKLRFE